MLVVETIARIRLDHLVRGVPIKKIARDLRVSKNTVRKVARGDETSYSYERKIQPMPKLGPWVEELERQLEGIVTLTPWLRHGRCFSVSECARYLTVVTAFRRSSSSMPSGCIAVSR